METKFKRIDLKAKPQDEQNLRKAAEKLGTTKVSKVIFDSVKQVANQEPEVFFCNRVGIRQTDENIIYGQLHLNKFCDEFKAVTGSLLSFDELQTLFENIGKLGSETIIQRDIRELVKLKLYQRLVENHPDMTVSMDNVPTKDLGNLYDIAEKLDQIPEVENRFAGIFWNAYQMGNENKIVVIQEEVERLKNTYRKSADSQIEKKKLAKVKELCSVLNSFLDDPEVIPENLISVFYFDPESKRFEPTGNFIKNSLRPNILFTR
jgi:hypothetical protein